MGHASMIWWSICFARWSSASRPRRFTMRRSISRAGCALRRRHAGGGSPQGLWPAGGFQWVRGRGFGDRLRGPGEVPARPLRGHRLLRGARALLHLRGRMTPSGQRDPRPRASVVGLGASHSEPSCRIYDTRPAPVGSRPGIRPSPVRHPEARQPPRARPGSAKCAVTPAPAPHHRPASPTL
jgi:hypothetical protein